MRVEQVEHEERSVHEVRPRSAAEQILRTYVTLTVVSTGASSLIWGINTLFLLDAGLSIAQAFAANAFFTAGMVVFEVPTGVVADTVGRRASYLLGSATLFGSTLLYLVMWQTTAPFVAWAASSMLLGLGFTFFSGATEAWLVDGLNATGYTGSLESAFAKGQVASGVAMLGGTVVGGLLAQVTNLGVPYIVRAVLLGVTFVVAWVAMHDVGFTPNPRTSVTKEMRGIVRSSLDHGLLNPPVRWLMLAAPFGAGVSIYGFYAVQPYLLELYGSKDSYAIAGLAAALVAGTQIAGGALVGKAAKLFRRRTSVLFVGSAATVVVLVLIGLVANFWAVLALLAVWGILFAMMLPVRQAFLNGLIPSAQRATVLSSDNLLSSGGGVVVQPALGKVADVWSYGISYIVGAGVQLLALPLVVLARREGAPSDQVDTVRSERRRRSRVRRQRESVMSTTPAARGQTEVESALPGLADGSGQSSRRVDVHGWDEGLPVPAGVDADRRVDCGDEARPRAGCGQP